MEGLKMEKTGGLNGNMNENTEKRDGVMEK